MLVVLVWCVAGGRQAAGLVGVIALYGVCLANLIRVTAAVEARRGRTSGQWCLVHSGLERVRQCVVHLIWVCSGGDVCRRVWWIVFEDVGSAFCGQW